MKLFLTLILSTAALYAQGDCGNCWPIMNSGCYPSQDAICNPQCCQVCEWYIDCDNHDCAYHIGPYCDCLPNCGLGAQADCGLSKKTAARAAARLHYSPVAFQSSLKTPIVIEIKRNVQINLKSRFWWKKGEKNGLVLATRNF